jgi:septation ring formation regulator EzrA
MTGRPVIPDQYMRRKRTVKKYTKPIMDVIELERIDVLTTSELCDCQEGAIHRYNESASNVYEGDTCNQGVCSKHPNDES